MNDNNVIEVVNDFYKLKSEYEKTLYNEKISIINNNTLSKEEKLKKYKLFKPKCINCKQQVGTIFLTKNNKLIAKCGATKSIFQKDFQPCNLDIQIERGNIELLSNIVDEFSKEKELDKDEIIKTKLNFFFNFVNEEETIENFKEQKKSYTENIETYMDYLKEFNDVVSNSENKKMIEQTILDIHESKQKIKSYIKNFREENNSQYIRDAVEEYENVLKKLTNKLNTLQYSYYTIESHSKNESSNSKKDEKLSQVHHLINKQYTIKDIEISIDAEYKIISNKK
jgi:uncharacterized protein YukE